MNFTNSQIERLLQAVAEVVQYHAGKPRIAALQVAYEAMTKQSAFPDPAKDNHGEDA